MESIDVSLIKSEDLFGDDSYIFDLNLQTKGITMKSSFRMYDLSPLKTLLNAYFTGKNGQISSWFSLSKTELSLRSIDSNVLNDLIVNDPIQIQTIAKKLNNLIEKHNNY